MPAEYLHCKESYMKKGVSEKTASARCAASYFKRHGVTVNDAHKKGLATFPELEGISEESFNLAKLIMTNLDDIDTQAAATKPDTHGEELKVTAINMDALDEFGILEITATKVGSTAYTGLGQAVTWTKQALEKTAPTWAYGNVSANHNGESYGRIISSFFENNVVRMLVKVNDEMKGWLKQFGKHVGVSIEAIKVKINKKFEIVQASGTGVTFVFPPHKPACPIEEGCGIVATDMKKDEQPMVVENAEEEREVEGTISATPLNILTLEPVNSTTTSTYTNWTITLPPTNITEANKNDGGPEKPVEKQPEPAIIETKGEIMVEEAKPAETICAKKHETLMKEKDSVIDAKVKEIESLKATVAKFEAEHKAKVLEAFVKETGLDAKAYETREVSVLEDIMATLKALKEKEAKEPVIDSGAIVTATKQETKPEGDVVTATISEAETKAKEEEKLRAELFAKAEKIDGIKR